MEHVILLIIALVIHHLGQMLLILGKNVNIIHVMEIFQIQPMNAVHLVDVCILIGVNAQLVIEMVHIIVK